MKLIFWFFFSVLLLFFLLCFFFFSYFLDKRVNFANSFCFFGGVLCDFCLSFYIEYLRFFRQFARLFGLYIKLQKCKKIAIIFFSFSSFLFGISFVFSLISAGFCSTLSKLFLELGLINANTCTHIIYIYIYIVYVYVYVSLIVLALYIVRLNMIIRYIFCLCLIVVGFVWWCLVLFCLVAVKNLTLLSLSFFLFSCFFSASTSILPQLLFFLGLTDKCFCSIARSFYSICKWN